MVAIYKSIHKTLASPAWYNIQDIIPRRTKCVRINAQMTGEADSLSVYRSAKLVFQTDVYKNAAIRFLAAPYLILTGLFGSIDLLLYVLNIIWRSFT